MTVSQERATRQKRALAEELGRVDAFRSAQQIYLDMRENGNGVGLTTVYNQLRTLAEAGTVDAVRSAEGETLYRRCATDRHHHHLLCRSCGRTVEIEAPDIEAWAAVTARSHRFTDVEHTVEIVGTCAPCRRRERSAGR